MKVTNIDLVYLQKEIDSGKSYPEISKQNKIGRSTICKYIKLGLLKKSNTKIINQYRNGHSMSDNTKDKIKKSMTGKKLSDETKRKMSLAKKGKTSNRKGKKASEETIKRMSMANKGRPHKKGYKLSDETKRKLSESHKGQIPWIKGRKHSEVTKLIGRAHV